MILRLKGVTKDYAGVRALDDVTVFVKPGAIGLLGPNGAGKSTLIKSLLGLVRLTAGEAYVLDLDVRRESREIRQQVGYMPEDDCYLAGMAGVQSVAFSGELAGLPRRTALRRAHEILDYVGIAEERYREVQTYSTGMKQKMKLAQALIHAPKIVFLDEPTSGLDPQGREKMLRLMRGLPQKGVTVVISTHLLHDVETCCDSVLILGHGKLLVYDTIENLRKTSDGRFTVHFVGPAEAFSKTLAGLGCPARPAGDGELEVVGDGEKVPQAVFRAAQEAGAVVRALEPSRTSLEEIFLKAVGA